MEPVAMLRTTAALVALLLVGPALAQSPRPPASIIVVNGRSVAALQVSVKAQGAPTASLPAPLPAGGRTVLKVPRLPGCLVSIEALFEDEADYAIDEFDICKEKQIRFVD
jgi:hypothetical protein